MKTKLTLGTKKEIDKFICKLIRDYGCVLVALQWDNEGFIKECEQTGHKIYHDSKAVPKPLYEK